MNYHHRNQLLHRFWNACPICYRRGAANKIRHGLRFFYCFCGAVWHWKKGSLHSPIIDTLRR